MLLFNKRTGKLGRWNLDRGTGMIMAATGAHPKGVLGLALPLVVSRRLTHGMGGRLVKLFKENSPAVSSRLTECESLSIGKPMVLQIGTPVGGSRSAVWCNTAVRNLGRNRGARKKGLEMVPRELFRFFTVRPSADQYT